MLDGFLAQVPGSLSADHVAFAMDPEGCRGEISGMVKALAALDPESASTLISKRIGGSARRLHGWLAERIRAKGGAVARSDSWGGGLTVVVRSGLESLFTQAEIGDCSILPDLRLNRPEMATLLLMAVATLDTLSHDFANQVFFMEGIIDEETCNLDAEGEPDAAESRRAVLSSLQGTAIPYAKWFQRLLRCAREPYWPRALAEAAAGFVPHNPAQAAFREWLDRVSAWRLKFSPEQIAGVCHYPQEGLGPDRLICFQWFRLDDQDDEDWAYQSLQSDYENYGVADLLGFDPDGWPEGRDPVLAVEVYVEFYLEKQSLVAQWHTISQGLQKT